MSPQRRKVRGGGGSKTMALLPNSSLVSPLNSAAKIAKDHRRFTIANLDSKAFKHRVSKTAPVPAISRASDENGKTEEASRVSVREIRDALKVLEPETADTSQGTDRKSCVSRVSNSKSGKKEEIARPHEKKTETLRSSSMRNAEMPRDLDVKNSDFSRSSSKQEGMPRVSDKKKDVFSVPNNKAVDVPRVSVTASSRPRSASASRSRNSSAGNFRSAQNSAIARNGAPDQCSSRSDLAIPRYGFADKSRAESRGRSSPNLSNVHRKEAPKTRIPDEHLRNCSRNASKEVMERKTGEVSVKHIPCANSNNNKVEGGKKLSEAVEDVKKTPICISFKVDSSLKEETTGNANSKASCLNENQEGNVRWSTSVLPSTVHVNNSRKASLDSLKMEGYGGKPLLSKNDFPQFGRYSTGSSVISSSSRLKTGPESGQSRQHVSNNQKGTGNELDLSNLLQRRLSLLEEKVNWISAELRKTKTILSRGDCSNTMSFLSDMLEKICSIERSMASQQRDDVASLHDVVMEDEFQMVHMEEKPRCSLGCNEPNIRVGDGLPENLKEISEQSKYVEQHDSEVIKHNSEYAHLQTIDPGHLESSTQSALSNGNVESNVLNSKTLSSREFVRKLPPLTIEDSNDCLEYDASLPIDNFHENMENVEPGFEQYIECDAGSPNDLHPIGDKVAVAGWYVSDGDAILLAHDDGCCSYIDIANMEEKAIFESPNGIATPVWNDCWLIRAPGSDGRAKKYVVAASTGNVIDCGFCSWDFESKSLASCHTEYLGTPQMALTEDNSIDKSLCRKAPSQPQLMSGCKAPPYDVSRGVLADAYHNESCQSPQWWYKPCGPLMAAAASSLTNMALYDIRDGDNVMRWDTKMAIASLDYTSPLQWRDRGKLVLAEEDGISIWDVHSMDVDCLQYIQLSGKQISCLYVHNSDAECSGGIMQRLSSSETESFDGICCTQTDVNVLDFRLPNGIGISFPSHGLESQCVFARRDMVLVAGLDHSSKQCLVQQWCVRKAMPMCTYSFPMSSSHYTHLSLTQVWGSSTLVMAMNGNGVYIFNAWRESGEACELQEMKGVIGSHDLLDPSFDYANSRVLLISRDRQASWCYLAQ